MVTSRQGPGLSPWRAASGVTVMATAVFALGSALLGACVGSFLNVVVYRLPQPDPRRRTLGGRSRCPHCGTQIAWFDNLPVLGWLHRRGRARCCGKSIAIRYPLVELLMAGLFLALALLAPHGEVVRPEGVDARALVAWLGMATFLSLLVANALIDLDTQLLLDVLNKPGMAIGCALGFWPGIAGRFSADTTVPIAMNTLLASVAGLLVGGGSVWAIRIVGTRLFRKEAMGFGDVKYLAMIGAFLGWRSALLTLLLACIFGAVIGGVGALRGGATKIPFGPFLALGAIASLFGERPILDLLFVTWPEWQRNSQVAQWLLPVLALLSFVALVALVLRSRRPG